MNKRRHYRASVQRSLILRAHKHETIDRRQSFMVSNQPLTRLGNFRQPAIMFGPHSTRLECGSLYGN